MINFCFPRSLSLSFKMFRTIGGGSYGKPLPTEMLFGTCLCLVVLGLFDFFVASRILSKARWFALHAVANAGVVVFGFGDVLRAFADPFQAAKGEYNLVPFYFIMSVHAYHMLAPGFTLKVADWVHHLLFAVAIGLIALTDQWGPVQTVVGFFLSG